MKRIVNRTIYDTAKAKLIVELIDGNLFLTDRGNWFHAGGAEITPLMDDQVIRLLEDNGEIELLEKHFRSYLTEA